MAGDVPVPSPTQLSRLASGVERCHLDHCSPVDKSDSHLSGVAAHFTVFDVFLKASAAGIEPDRRNFAAVRAAYVG